MHCELKEHETQFLLYYHYVICCAFQSQADLMKSEKYTTLNDSYRTGTSEIVQQVKSVPTSIRSILSLIHYFLYKYIVWSHILIFLLSSMFSSTLLIACTISVFPV